VNIIRVYRDCRGEQTAKWTEIWRVPVSASGVEKPANDTEWGFRCAYN